MWKSIKILTVACSFIIGAMLLGLGVADCVWFHAYLLSLIEIFFGLGFYSFSKNLTAAIQREEEPVSDDTQTVYRMKW